MQEAEKELEEVTVLLRQSLANNSQGKPRKTVPITEVLHIDWLFFKNPFIAAVSEKLVAKVFHRKTISVTFTINFLKFKTF